MFIYFCKNIKRTLYFLAKEKKLGPFWRIEVAFKSTDVDLIKNRNKLKINKYKK